MIRAKVMITEQTVRMNVTITTADIIPLMVKSAFPEIEREREKYVCLWWWWWLLLSWRCP